MMFFLVLVNERLFYGPSSWEKGLWHCSFSGHHPYIIHNTAQNGLVFVTRVPEIGVPSPPRLPGGLHVIVCNDGLAWRSRRIRRTISTGPEPRRSCTNHLLLYYLR